MDSYLSKISVACKSWIEALAAIMTDAAAKNRKWKIIALKTDKGYEIYEKKPRKIIALGAFENSSDTTQIRKIKKKLKKVRGTDASLACLRLSPSNILQTNIRLPGGAADVLEPVIKNQMRRLVPWSEDETCFAYKINREKSSGGELDITVIAASTPVITGAMEDLSALNLNVEVAEYADSLESSAPSELLVTGTRQRDKHISTVRRYITLFALAVAGIMVSGIASLSGTMSEYQKSSIELETFRDTIAQLRKRNAKNIRLTEQKSFLIVKKKSNLPVVMLLDNLSRTIPDKAWLQKLEVNGTSITINGNATNTPDLVKVLEASEVLTGVRFSAPTTRTGQANLETFSIIADISTGTKNRVEKK